MWPSHTVEYYLAVKRNKILPQATQRTDLTDAVCSVKETSHRECTACDFIHMTCPEKANYRKLISGYQGLGGREGTGVDC